MRWFDKIQTTWIDEIIWQNSDDIDLLTHIDNIWNTLPNSPICIFWNDNDRVHLEFTEIDNKCGELWLTKVYSGKIDIFLDVIFGLPTKIMFDNY